MDRHLHNAIVVTSKRGDVIQSALDKAMEYQLPTTDVVWSPLWRYRIFLIVPDRAPNIPDGAREAWLAWARAQSEDESNAFEWSELT